MTSPQKFATEDCRALNTPTEMLLDCAHQLESSGLLTAARNAYQAAALADETPQSRFELAEFEFRTECFQNARREYETLLESSVDSNDRRLAEAARHNLAAVLRKTGDVGQAATLQSRSTVEALSLRGELSPADLTGRALDAVNQGDLSLAEDLLLRSLAVEKKSGNQSGEATDCANLGALALLRGDNTIGIRFLARAYHLHQRLNDRLNAGTDLMNLAEAFQNVSRWSLASRCLRRAMSLFEKCGAEQSLNTAHLRLREVREIQGVLKRDPLLN